jgi:ribonuclease P protein component
MRPEQRLRKPADFDAVYKSGRVEGNRLLVVRTRPNGTPTTRFGFVATKAVGGSVVRNRTKRRLRAIAAGLDVAPGLDIVASARKTAAEAPFAEVKRALITLLERSGVLVAAAPEANS